MIYLKIALALLLISPTSAWCFGVGTVGVLGSGGVAGESSPTLKDSNTDTAVSSDYQIGRYSSWLYVVGNFEADSRYTLSSFDLYLSRTGTATGTLTPVIYATSSGAPTGSATTGSAVNRSNLATSEGIVNFEGFSFTVVSGTEYAIGVYADSVDGDETVNIYYSAGGDAYTNEIYVDDDGTPAFSADQDKYIKYRTYGN